MRASIRTTQRQETSLRVDPKVLLTSQLLQLSQQELTQTIETELNENPALERLSQDDDHLSEETILRSIAPRELRPRGDDREMWRSLAPDDDTPSWIDLAASNTSLAEHLSAQILPSLPRELRHVGEYVVGCVNDNGYLYEPVEEIALACNCSIEEAASVIAALRKCDPPGIGANGVQDCILIQLKAHQTLEGKIARKIVRDHLDEFATGKVMKFARKFSAHPDVIEESIRLIYECTPFPGESFKGAHSSEQKLPAIKPDLILSRSEFGWDIVVVGPDPAEFSVNGFYRDRLVNNKRDKSVSPEEKRHLSVYVQRASDFISSIEQRRKTMQRIAEVLVQKQMGFIATGDYQFLQPLTRTLLAAELGIHESTVSRATQGKFVQIANGETVAFDIFFKPALRVQKMIEEILATENPDNPLSDERIAKMLADRGVDVARRTVNKYRDRTKLLSSRKRRTA